MRVLLLAPLLTACDPAAEGDDHVEPPFECEGPSARLFYGATPDDVILPGTALPAESGVNGGAHVSIGLAVSSPTPEVAWRIDLVDVETEELVSGNVGAGQYLYTKLTSWTDDTCTGYLPGVRVCLGDCQNAALACEYDGRRLRAEAYITTIGGDTVGDPQVTVEFVLAGDCPI